MKILDRINIAMAYVIWIAFLLIKLLMALTTCERTWTTGNAYFTDNIQRDCPKYEDILPKGICHKYLKTNRIAQTVKIMERKNRDLFGFYDVGFKFIQLWFAGGTPKTSFIKQWLGSCLDKPKVKQLVENTTIPSLGEMENCLNSTREGVCHIYHPTCFHKPANNGYEYFPRSICKDSCESFYGECERTVQFLSRFNILYKNCPRFLVTKDLGKLPECRDFLTKDIQRIERCLLVEKSDSTVTTKTSFFQHHNNCFLGNGKSYHGKMKITKSGKICVNWNKIPYLSNISFPMLEKNYCRNPEGYGVQPWCYVDIKNRTWEYCEIEACEDSPHVSKVTFNDKYIVWIICSVVIVPLVLLLTITVTWSHFSRKKRQNTNDVIQPYASVNLKGSGDVAKQIQEFNKSDL